MAAHQAPLPLGFSRQEHCSGLPFPSAMHESEKWKWSRSVVSDSLRLHGLQPTRLLCPWDFPGKSTGVGCHCLLRNSNDNSLKGSFLKTTNFSSHYYFPNLIVLFCWTTKVNWGKVFLNEICHLFSLPSAISKFNKGVKYSIQFVFFLKRRKIF